MDQSTHNQQRRALIRRELTLRLAAQQQYNTEDAARNAALNRITLQAEDRARESWWNRIEIVAVILVLATVEILRTGGLL